MQTNLCLSAPPAIVSRLDFVIARIRRLYGDTMTVALVNEIAGSLKELEAIRADLNRLLSPQVDLHATAKYEAKPDSFDAVKFFAEKIGLPASEAERFWHYFCAKGWRVGSHTMKSWHHALVNWKLNWQERSAGAANGYYVPNAAPAGPTLAEREMRRLEKIAKDL